MIKKILTEEQVDFAIGLLFIHLQLYFTSEEYPFYNISENTKISAIFEEVINNNGNTVNDLFSEIASSVSVELNCKEPTNENEMLEIIEKINTIKSQSLVDTTPIVDFFSFLTVRDVLSFKVPESKELIEIKQQIGLA